MSETEALITPEECTLLIVDFQAGLGFGVESSPRQAILNNAIALARTAVTFSVPVVVSTSASKVYSGPLLPGLQAVLQGVKAIVVADACGGLTLPGHELALRRMEAAGARLTSWIQVLLEFQRDWTRHETYEAARAIVEANGGGLWHGTRLCPGHDSSRVDRLQLK
jgi:nicotinamidase-related amidase